MNQLFAIAAGGTGAKVVESLIYLCAAGNGPDHLDILLLDVDQSNGNADRTRKTADLYAKLQRWDWTLSPRPASKGGNVPLRGTQLFKTKITLHISLDEIETVGEGGLAVHLSQEEGAQKLLDLFYDANEQQSPCERGFLARPNLGSLVLGGHLKSKFEAPEGGAADFRTRLLEAIGNTTQQEPIRVAVAGSIFGGTGASLFPIACERIKEAVTPESGKDANWQKVVPVAVMLMPYFLPQHSDDGGLVDPSRFFADTANTLSHYHRSDALKLYQDVFLVGSDAPERNPLIYIDGAREQANPPFLEEMVAAQAILHPGSSGGESSFRTLLLSPPGTSVSWESLPFSGQEAPRTGLLLELAAFLLHKSKSSQPLSGGFLEASRHWPAEFELLDFHNQLLMGWASQHFSHALEGQKSPGDAWRELSNSNQVGGGADISSADTPLAEFVFRLLLWVRTTLPTTSSHDLVSLAPAYEGHDYAAVWEILCGVQADEIEPREDHHKGMADNALVRLVRGIGVAMAKLSSGHAVRGIVSRTLAAQASPGFPGQDNKDQASACSLPISENEFAAIASALKLPSEVISEFTKTEILL